MSVLIKGMEMPTSCGLCPFKYQTMEGGECMFDVAYTTYQSRPKDCPLCEHREIVKKEDADGN